MLLGSLREQLCYPLPQVPFWTKMHVFFPPIHSSYILETISFVQCQDSFDDDTLRDTLKKVRLQKMLCLHKLNGK